MSNQVHLDVVKLEYINKNTSAYGLVMWDNYRQEIEDYIDADKLLNAEPLDLLRLAKTYDRFDEFIDYLKYDVPEAGMHIDDDYFDREDIAAVLLAEDEEEDEEDEPDDEQVQ